MTVSLKSFHGGYWGEHPDFPHKEWIDEVAEDATRLGYWDWVAMKINITKVASND